MFIQLARFSVVLIALSGLAGAAQALTLEAPVTMDMTISVTGPESERTTKAGTDYQAKLKTFKFTNREYLEILADEGVISSTRGWKLVARWTSGDSVADYQFYLVKKGQPALALDSNDGGLDLDFGALAAGYNERWKNGQAISGSGTVKFATAFALDGDGDSFRMGGVGTGTYSIKAVTKNGAPILVFNSLKLTLLGGVSSTGIEGVVEMTLSIGKATVVPEPPSPIIDGSVIVGGVWPAN
ncbi:MAG: hypothetical protein K0R17_1599 [Rariglobus sp.]|jgi:hypothetical protein|nr:hypothetical protein [Rariglobus sp.]